MQYITKQDLDKFIVDTDDLRNWLLEHKKRGKGYYIPKENEREYITLNYVIWIAKYLNRKLKTPEQVLDIEKTLWAVQNEDWEVFSINYKCVSRNADLARYLLKTQYKYKDPENIHTNFEMIMEQADYLKRASKRVASWLIELREDEV